jgi:hypothetical protein
MVVHLLRSALAALALLLSATLVQAQQQQQRVPAPDRHPETGLVFPAEIPGVPKIRSAGLSTPASW